MLYADSFMIFNMYLISVYDNASFLLLGKWLLKSHPNSAANSPDCDSLELR